MVMDISSDNESLDEWEARIFHTYPSLYEFRAEIREKLWSRFGKYVETIQLLHYGDLLHKLSHTQIIKIGHTRNPIWDKQYGTRTHHYFLSGCYLYDSLGWTFCGRGDKPLNLPFSTIITRENIIRHLSGWRVEKTPELSGEHLRQFTQENMDLIRTLYTGKEHLEWWVAKWNNHEGRELWVFLPHNSKQFIQAYTGEKAKYSGKKRIQALLDWKELPIRQRIRYTTEADIYDLYHDQKIPDHVILATDRLTLDEWYRSVGESLGLQFHGYGRVYSMLRAKREEEYNETYQTSNQVKRDGILREIRHEYLKLIQTKPREFFL